MLRAGENLLYLTNPGQQVKGFQISTLEENTYFSNIGEDKTKQTPWPLVRERTIQTERPPSVYEILCELLWIEGCRVVSAANPPR
jgi:hypothetical protein